MYNNAKPAPIGTPTKAKILAIILSITTRGSSSSSSLSSSLLVLLEFLVLSFMEAAGAPVKPLAFATRLSELRRCFSVGVVVGWRFGLLGFQGGGFARLRGGNRTEQMSVFMASYAVGFPIQSLCCV